MFFLGTVLSAAVYSEDDSDETLQTTDLVEIIIESDSLELRIKEKTVVFSENVTAQREDLTIECDKMRVYYIESENGDVDINKILATGHVKITRAGDLSGTAEKAVYDLVEETVTLTGKPVIKQGKNSLKGSMLIYHFKDDSISGTDIKAVYYKESEESISTGGE
jgi:lipopolysaccharide export system protein LptA